jgi:hypothetical protein
MKIVFYIVLLILSGDSFSQILEEKGTIIDSAKVYNGEKNLPGDLINRADNTSTDKAQWISLNQKEHLGAYLNLDHKIYCGSFRCYTTPLNVDISSFQVLSTTPYSRDKNNVYCYNTLTCEDCDDCCGACWCDIFIVENARPAKFRYISNSYATDGKKVYYWGLLISDADSKTFKVIDTPKDFSLAVDKNHVYMRNEIFKDADPSTIYYDRTNVNNNDQILIFGDKNNKWEFDISKNSIVRIEN